MKSIFQSKVFWVNALTILVVVATFFGYVPDQEVAEQASVVLTAMNPLINLILRAMTNTGVTLSLPTLSVRDELER